MNKGPRFAKPEQKLNFEVIIVVIYSKKMVGIKKKKTTKKLTRMKANFHTLNCL